MEQASDGMGAAATACPHLPADVLRQVFGRILQPDESADGRGLPARTLVQRWFAIRLTCRAWAAALQDTPLTCELYAAPAAFMPWLTARPLHALRMVSHYGGGPTNDLGMSAADGEGAACVAERSVGARPHAALAWGDRLLDSLVAGLEGVHEWHRLIQPSAKFWGLSSCAQLRCLCLEGPINRAGDACTFSTALLAGLPALETLELSCFYNYDLR